MKILVIHCAYQFKGGEDTVVDEEIKLLRQSGQTVELLRFTNDGAELRKFLLLPFNFSSYAKTKKIIRSFRPDVVHIHNLHFGASPSVVYAVNQSAIPFVCTLHNYRLLCPSAILFHKGHAFLASLNTKFPWKAVRAGVYKNSKLLTFWMAVSMQLHHKLGTWLLPDRYIVLSKAAKKLFLQSRQRFNEEQFVVKPNFCSQPLLQKQERNEDFLFVGRLSEEKGIPFLLKLFSDSKHKLTIAGDGPLKEDVLQVASQNANIRYVGSLQKNDLFSLMQASSALLFPSIWYEGMPLTIIEAFACGLPVIATKLGAMEFMVTPGQDGLLFEAGNATELKQALNDWEQLSAGEKQRYSENSKATYEAFYTPEKNAEQLLAIYRNVLQKEAQPLLALTD